MEHFVVLTPIVASDHTLDSISSYLKDLQNIKFVISRETHPHLHYHAYLETPRIQQDLRYHFKEVLKLRPRFSSTEIRDRVRAIAYTIKEGNYRVNEIDAFELIKACQISHKKESMLGYDKDVGLIMNDPGTKEKSDKELIRELLKLHVKYNRKIYPQHITAQLRTFRCKYNQEYEDYLVNKIIDDM